METETKLGYGSDGLPYADEPPKEIKINPNRKQHYQMVVKIKDAPLVFQVIRGSEQYQAMNCRYTTSRFAGSSINPHYSELLKYIKVDDTTYVTDFYTDTPLNEDYYGQGVCQWQFLGAGTSLLATGKDVRETILSADVEPSDLLELVNKSEINIKLFYGKSLFPKMDFVKENDSGPILLGTKQKDLSFTQGGSMEDLFTVELTIRRLEK